MNNWTATINRLTFGRALILGLGIAGFYYFFVYDSGATRLAAIAQAQSQVQSLNQQILADQAKIQEANKYKEIAAQVGSTINTLLKVIPEKFDVSDLMKIVSDEIKVAGSSLDAVTPGRTETSSVGKEFDELSVHLQATGTFTQHMIFLSNLTKVKAILLVRKLKMTVTRAATREEPPLVQMEGDIVAYRYHGGKTASGTGAQTQ